MTQRQQQKYCLITGCSEGGIGYSLAEEFAQRGVHVFATARTPSKVSGLKDHPNVTVLPLDVVSSTSIAECMQKVKLQTGGKLDYLVNNSGQQYCMSVMDVDIEKARAMYDVNVWGPVATCQAFGPLIIAAKGTIVNIASCAGYIHPPWMGLYAGSKAAIDQISETLRLEMQPLGVKVVTVVAGAIKTRLFDNSVVDSLPAGSYYSEAQTEFEMRSRGLDVKEHTPAAEFSRNLVGDVMSGATGHVYRGKMSSMIRHVSSLVPESLVDRMLVAGTGLDKVKPPISNA